MIRRAGEHAPALRDSLAVRVIYCDLDGTLLGPGGSLFAHPSGTTVGAAQAVAALPAADIDLVLVSGRTREQLREVARVVGARGFIAEMGGLIVSREATGETVMREAGAFTGKGTAHDAIQRSGAPGVLLEAFPRKLEPHAPWAFVPRDCSVLLRGEISHNDANRMLEDTGYGWLHLADNGIIETPPRRFANLDVESVHIYHLAPAGVSKRSAVARDRSSRGLEASQALAIGNSAADAAVAPEVGAFFLVANGLPAVEPMALGPNVYVTDESYGLGFAEAVMPFLRP